MKEDLLVALAATFEIENVILTHYLNEMAVLRSRTKVINRRVEELRLIIQANEVTADPVTIYDHFRLHQGRQRVDAAVAELKSFSVEYEEIRNAADNLTAARTLRVAFRPASQA